MFHVKRLRLSHPVRLVRLRAARVLCASGRFLLPASEALSGDIGQVGHDARPSQTSRLRGGCGTRLAGRVREPTAAGGEGGWCTFRYATT